MISKGSQKTLTTFTLHSKSGNGDYIPNLQFLPAACLYYNFVWRLTKMFICFSGKHCALPSGWQGRWFEFGEREAISISNKTMSHKGHCLASKTNKFIFHDRWDYWRETGKSKVIHTSVSYVTQFSFFVQHYFHSLVKTFFNSETITK